MVLAWEIMQLKSEGRIGGFSSLAVEFQHQPSLTVLLTFLKNASFFHSYQPPLKQRTLLSLTTLQFLLPLILSTMLESFHISLPPRLCLSFDALTDCLSQVQPVRAFLLLH